MQGDWCPQDMEGRSRRVGVPVEKHIPGSENPGMNSPVKEMWS